MKVLFDTSVLIAALVEPHARHQEAWPWLRAAANREVEGAICLHTIAELYGTLTRLPNLRPRPTPHEVLELVRRSVLEPLQAVELKADSYEAVLQRCADRGLVSGAVYDALIEQAARSWGADLLLTLNRRDFARLGDDEVPRVVHPAEVDPGD